MPLRSIDKDRQGVGLGEFVGGVDNKAGHYSVSPGRQGWADGPREEATHVAVPRGRRPRHQSRSSTSAGVGTREPIRANECPAAGRHQVSSQWPVGVRDGQTSLVYLDLTI